MGYAVFQDKAKEILENYVADFEQICIFATELHKIMLIIVIIMDVVYKKII